MNAAHPAALGGIITLDWHDFVRHGLSGAPELLAQGKKIACAIGVFDGVHLGHRELLRRVTEAHDALPFVLTFRDNPKHKTRLGFFQGELTSQRQRLALFASLGVRGCVLIDFSDDFSKLTGADFLSRLVGTGLLGRLVVGEDFRCGRDLGMDATAMRDFAKGFGVETDIVPTVFSGGEAVSSSRIRATIASGDLAGAARLLGSPFELDLGDAKREREGYRIRRIVPPDGSYDAEWIESPYGKALERATIRIADGVLLASPGPGEAYGARFCEGIKQV